MLTDNNILIASLTLITLGAGLAWLPLAPLTLGTILLSGLIWKHVSLFRKVNEHDRRTT